MTKRLTTNCNLSDTRTKSVQYFGVMHTYDTVCLLMRAAGGSISADQSGNAGGNRNRKRRKVFFNSRFFSNFS